MNLTQQPYVQLDVITNDFKDKPCHKINIITLEVMTNRFEVLVNQLIGLEICACSFPADCIKHCELQHLMVFPPKYKVI